MDGESSSVLQTQSPVKTEWNSRCVIFTYFQGDINKEVDEHFSRALGLSVSSLRQLSPSSQRCQEDVVLTNGVTPGSALRSHSWPCSGDPMGCRESNPETNLAPNQWHFSPPWTKPQPEATLGNGDASCSMHEFDPVEVNPYPITTTRSLLAQPNQPWQMPTLPYSSSPDLTYPSAFSVPETPVPVPEPPQEESQSLLSFLQQDRSPALPEQPISWEDGYLAQRAGSSGLPFNFPTSSSSAQSITPGGAWGTIWNSGDQTLVSCMQDKKLYFTPVCEPVSTGYADERSQFPEMNKEFFY